MQRPVEMHVLLVVKNVTKVVGATRQRFGLMHANIHDSHAHVTTLCSTQGTSNMAFRLISKLHAQGLSICNLAETTSQAILQEGVFAV